MHQDYQLTSLTTKVDARILATASTGTSTRVVILLKVCLWGGLAVFLLSIALDRFIGVEAIHVVQTFFFAVTLMSNTHASLSTASDLCYVNGYNSLFKDLPSFFSFGTEPSLPQSLQLLHLQPFFPENCNIMLWLHGVFWLLGDILFLAGRLSNSKRTEDVAVFVLGDLGLLLCLFNSINVGFSAGLNLSYWSQVPNDLGVQAFCIGSIVLGLIVLLLYSLLAAFKPDLFSKT